MRLEHLPESQPSRRELHGEPRYDAETVRKVACLADRLQARHQETMSAREIEDIGGEVGLKPEFIRDALRRLDPRAPTATAGSAPALKVAPDVMQGISKAWWAAGWAIPFSLPVLAEMLFHKPDYGGMLFLPAIAFYIGVGVFLAHLAKVRAAGAHESRALSRQEALEVFFQLQSALQGQRLHRAYLSVDVTGSTEMKRSAGDLEVEYSFGQYQRWVQQVVRATGGQLHSAAGDGLMAEFPDAASAVRAARVIQEEIGRFNVEQNRLPVPFRIRCGVSAGEVAIEPGAPVGSRNSPVIDQAATLQKRAMPGDILVSGEVAPAALTELGSLSAVPDGVCGASAFSWRGTV